MALHTKHRLLNAGGMILGAMITAIVCGILVSVSSKIGIVLILGLVILILLVALLSKPQSLVVPIAAYPAFLVSWSAAFPGMSYRLREGMFPVINLGFIQARVDELVLYGLFGVWASLMVLSRLSQKISSRLLRLVLILCFLTMVSLVLGILNDNPQVTSDLRFMAPSFVGPLMAIWALRRMDQGWLIRIVKLTLLSLVVSNLLLLVSYLPVFQGSRYFSLWHRHLPPVGFTIILYVGLLSLAVSYKPSLWVLLGTLMSLSLAIFTIPKWWLLGIVVGTLVVLYGVFYPAAFSHLLVKKSLVKKSLRLAGFGMLVVLAAVIMTLMFSERVEHSLDAFAERVLREDMGGDISGGRFEIWSKLIENIMEHPVIGNGLGFRPVGVLPAEIEAQGRFIEDHNIVLWLAARFGIPLVLLLGGLCLQFWRVGWRAYRVEDRQFQKTLILACMSNFVVILSMSMVGQWFFLYEINVLFWWNVAAVWVIYSQNQVSLEKGMPVLAGNRGGIILPD